MSTITFDYLRDAETGSQPVNGGRVSCHLLAFGGTAPAGSEVPIYVNGQLVGTAQADASGHWEFAYQPMAGQYFFGAGENQTGYMLNVDAPTSPVLGRVSDGSNGELLASGDSIGAHPLSIAGSAPPNSQVGIYDNGKLVATVTADAKGNWQYFMKAEGGHHELSLSADGPALFSVDIEAAPVPAVTEVVDKLGTEIGNGDSVLDYTTLHISGVGEPYTTYTIYNNGQPFTSVVTDADGRWDFYVYPEAGHQSFSVGPDGPAYEFTLGEEAPIVDPVPPVDPVEPTQVIFGGMIDDGYGHDPHDIPAGGSTDNHLPLMFGTAPAGATVYIVDRVSGQTVGVATANDEGQWSTHPVRSLSEGHYELFATAFGQVSDTFSFDISAGATDPIVTPEPPVDPVDPVDPTQPGDPAPAAVTINGIVDRGFSDDWHEIPAGGTASSWVLAIHGSAPAGAIVHIYDRVSGNMFGVATANEKGEWQAMPVRSLPDGHYEFYAMTWGSAVSADFPIDIDSSATLPTPEPVPPVDPVDPVDPTPTPSDDHVYPFGSTNPADQVAIGVWDARSGTVVREGGMSGDALPEIYGHATANSTVQIYSDGRLLATVQANAEGWWNWNHNSIYEPGEVFHDGNYSIHAVVDGVATESFQFGVDGPAPTVNNIMAVTEDDYVDLHDGHITEQAYLTLNGYAAPYSTITVYDGNTVIAVVPVSSQGTWGYSSDQPLVNGSHDIRIESSIGKGIDVAHFTVEVPTADEALAFHEDVPTFDGITDMGADHDPREVPLGGSTDNNQPLLHGTAPAGTVIYIVDKVSGQIISNAQADADGHWQSLPYQWIADGHYELYAMTAWGAASNTFSFDIAPHGTETAPSDEHVAPIDTAAADISLHVIATQDGVAREVMEGDDSIGWDIAHRAEGQAAPGATFSVVEWSGPWTIVHDVTADANGHWAVDLEVRSTGQQTVFVSTEAGMTHTLTFNWEFVASNSTNEMDETGQSPLVADLLADVGAALFADEAPKSMEPTDASHIERDALDLGQILQGGVQADMAAEASRAAIYQEDLQHG